MIEFYTYELINAVMQQQSDIKYIDKFENQYNRLEENVHPYNQPTMFIEFVPRQDIKTRNVTVEYGSMQIRYHILIPKPDTSTTRKKNINSSLQQFEIVTTCKRILNDMSTAKYMSGTTINNLLLEAAPYYKIESGHLIASSVDYTDEFALIILTFNHEYQDNSNYLKPQFSSGWTFTVSPEIFTSVLSLTDGDFNNDFSGDFDTDNMTAPIYYREVRVESGNTIVIDAYAFNEEGIPLDMQYSIDNGQTWVDTNIFSDLIPSDYYVIIRNSRGDGLYFSMNPIKIE